jgi:DNA replication protein DnaC
VIKLTEGHYKYLNIGRRFWEADLSEIDSGQKKAIRTYVKSFKFMISKGIGLYLWGSNGSGKTYIATALLKYAWTNWRVTGYCVTAAELKESWIEDRPAHDGSDETMIERVTTARLLVIDDIGREHRAASGFAENRFGMLLRDRSRDLKTTIMTSNLDPQQFGEIYGRSIVELVKECTHPIKLVANNYRSSKALEIKEKLEER